MSPEIATAAPIARLQMNHGVTAHLRSPVIALTAFLTLVDLFATQAILPSLARAYQVSPAAMGFAVNASAMGMAISSLAVAFLSQRIDRRRGILIKSRSAGDSDLAAGGCAGSDDLHRACASRRACAWPRPSP